MLSRGAKTTRYSCAAMLGIAITFSFGSAQATPLVDESTSSTLVAAKEIDGSVTIFGGNEIGDVLGVDHASIYVLSGATYSYQWYRNGKKISGATKNEYKITKDDSGKKLKVKVRIVKKGYETTTKTSNIITVADAAALRPGYSEGYYDAQAAYDEGWRGANDSWTILCKAGECVDVTMDIVTNYPPEYLKGWFFGFMCDVYPSMDRGRCLN